MLIAMNSGMQCDWPEHQHWLEAANSYEHYVQQRNHRLDGTEEKRQQGPQTCLRLKMAMGHAYTDMHTHTDTRTHTHTH